jgi:hypothetical protein
MEVACMAYTQQLTFTHWQSACSAPEGHMCRHSANTSIPDNSLWIMT